MVWTRLKKILQKDKRMDALKDPFLFLHTGERGFLLFSLIYARLRRPARKWEALAAALQLHLSDFRFLVRHSFLRRLVEKRKLEI